MDNISSGEFKKLDLIVGKNLVVLTNLESKKIMGLESQDMILCADDGGKPVCLGPLKEVPSGSKIL